MAILTVKETLKILVEDRRKLLMYFFTTLILFVSLIFTLQSKYESRVTVFPNLENRTETVNSVGQNNLFSSSPISVLSDKDDVIEVFKNFVFSPELAMQLLEEYNIDDLQRISKTFIFSIPNSECYIDCVIEILEDGLAITEDRRSGKIDFSLKHENKNVSKNLLIFILESSDMLTRENFKENYKYELAKLESINIDNIDLSQTMSETIESKQRKLILTEILKNYSFNYAGRVHVSEEKEIPNFIILLALALIASSLAAILIVLRSRISFFLGK